MTVQRDPITNLWTAYAAPGVKLFSRYTLKVLLAVLAKRGYKASDYVVQGA